ncbi:nucleotidyl transferase AbiEii/AbiGii toxin family protein [Diaphorobacter sp. HDW4A]|uniref:nucleotidyl transferase AbiEii/AbiGii toxin family protein n=1 Tax=Diaphorobacter sp. HDW4A TaxID=2714924 RepID=UPI00140C5234|nr:nucleotidyl transferase AbiEii/AbiGii toxin family protein [Diaphorobacter sp. HDW4A]QIL81118.1 nucleotidyl transferase AbiEii/AbiGii toxin family protein [Diaphorobacter sp. HDW4A]
MKKGAAAEVPTGEQLEAIKRAAIVAMFADDELMDVLVLKGGNAMDIVHQVNSRASVDLDFSMKDDLDHEAVLPNLQRALEATFDLQSYLAFDIKLSVRPGRMPDELASFWGGYLVEFKLISNRRASEVGRDLAQMRREAIRLGEGPKFTIDISRHEYVEHKEAHELDGYTIYVYSPAMIVCEKLRAICQQMPEYGQIIQRSNLGNQRARDFIDIEALVRKFGIDLSAEESQQMVMQMFAAKRVPLLFLANIPETRDFHALGYEEVRAAMKPGVQVGPFDHYFDFVVREVKKLEAFWNE